MGECICSSCKNLKSIIDDNGAVEYYECSFGFPSDECSYCDADTGNCDCELTCSHYECDNEDEVPVILYCKKCGKELTQVCGDGREGDVYCFDCYLNQDK